MREASDGYTYWEISEYQILQLLPPGSRLVIVACDILDQRRKQLWNLSDYRVSSVSGVSVHLMPKGA